MKNYYVDILGERDPFGDTTASSSFTGHTQENPDMHSDIQAIINSYMDKYPVRKPTSYGGGYGDRSSEIVNSGVDMNSAARLEAAAPEILNYLKTNGFELQKGDKLLNFQGAAQVYSLLGMPKEYLNFTGSTGSYSGSFNPPKTSTFGKIVNLGLNVMTGGAYGIANAVVNGGNIEDIAKAAVVAYAGGQIADLAGMTDALVDIGFDQAYAQTLSNTVGGSLATGANLEETVTAVLGASAKHGMNGGDFFNTEADRTGVIFGGGDKLNDSIATQVTAKTGVPQPLSNGGSVAVNSTGGLTVRSPAGAIETVDVVGKPLTIGGTLGTYGLSLGLKEGSIPTAADVLGKAGYDYRMANKIVSYNEDTGKYTYADGSSPQVGDTVNLDGDSFTVGKNSNGSIGLVPESVKGFNPITDYVDLDLSGLGVDQPALKTIDPYVSDFNKTITVETVNQGTPVANDKRAEVKEEGLFDGLDVGISKPEIIPAEVAPTMEIDTSYKVEVPQETETVQTTGNEESGGGAKDGSEATASDSPEKVAEKARIEAEAAKAAKDPDQWAKDVLAAAAISGGMLTGGTNDITYETPPTFTSAPAAGGSTAATSSPTAVGSGNEGSSAPVGSTSSGVGGAGGGTAANVVSAAASGSGENFTTPDGVEYAIDDITAMPVAVGSTRVGANGQTEVFKDNGRWEAQGSGETPTGTAPSGFRPSVVTPSGNPADNPSFTTTPVITPTPVETPSVGTVGEADSGSPVAPEEVVDPFGDTTAEDSTIEDTTSGTGGDGGSAVDGTGTTSGTSDTTGATGTGVEGTVDGGLGSDGTVGGTGNGEGTGEGEGTGDGTGDGSGSGSGSGNGSGTGGMLGGLSGSAGEPQSFLEGIERFTLSETPYALRGEPSRYEQQKQYIDKLFEGLFV